MADRCLPTSSHNGLGGHEERTGEAVRDPFGVQTAGDVEHDVADFVRDGKPLTLAPVVDIDDDEGNCRMPDSTCSRGETTDAAERESEHLDAAFLEKLYQVGNGLVAQAPVPSERVCGAVGLDRIAQYGIGRVARLVPLGAGQLQDILDGEIPFEVREDRGLDLGFAALRRECVLPELQVFEDQVGVPEQVVDRRVQGVGERDEDAAARHGFVALILADGLRRNQMVDGSREVSQREPGGRPGELESYSDHFDSVPFVLDPWVYILST